MASDRPSGARSSPERQPPEEIARTNPKVNLSQLREAEEAIRQLRARGVAPPVSSVRSPFGQRLPRSAQED